MKGTCPILGSMNKVDQRLYKGFPTKVPLVLLQGSTMIGCGKLNLKKVMVMVVIGLGLYVENVVPSALGWLLWLWK